MASAARLACTSSSFAWPFCAASLATAVAAAACSFTLSRKPISHLLVRPVAPDVRQWRHAASSHGTGPPAHRALPRLLGRSPEEAAGTAEPALAHGPGLS